MATTFTFTNALDAWPAGTSVGAYPRANQSPGWDRSSAPSGSATSTATVASSGSLAFTGLADDTRYFAAAQASGQWVSKGFRTDPAAATVASSTPANLWLPTGGILENFPRSLNYGTGGSLVSGQMRLAGGMTIPAGKTVTSLSVQTSTTAVTTPTNQWFALYSQALAKLAVTVDDTTAAWAAGAVKTLALSAPYTPSVDTAVYVGVVVVAAAMPNLACLSGPIAVAPFIGGQSSTGLTNPASAPATATTIASAAVPFYAYAS